MPGITHRSTRPPQLKTRLLSHGTLECRDIAASRRFYEEALGLEVVQQAPVALFIRLGSQHCYAVVENPRAQEMSLMAHNGIDLASEEEVRNAYDMLQQVKDEYGWWEICHLPEGGYAFRFKHRETDLTGRDDLSPDEVRSRFQNPLDHVPVDAAG
jgi:catechol 2,3-dioxygenase-like lactoylglutathione lyase family enzyme